MKRDVLRIYDSNSEDKLDSINKGLEKAINHLGLRMDYHDISKGVPRYPLNKYVGIIVMLKDYDISNSKQLWKWIDSEIKGPRKVILLQLPISFSKPKEMDMEVMELVNSSLKHMGIKLGTQVSYLPPDIEVVYKDRSMVEFERKFTNDKPYFLESNSFDKENQVYLKLKRKSTGVFSDTVIITKKGAVIMGNAMVYQDYIMQKYQWRVDPFKFFSKALNVHYLPKLDVTTRNGNRVMFTHVDGDGFTSASKIDKKWNDTRSCGAVFVDHILKEYTEIPFSLSVITSEINPKYNGHKKLVETAKEMYALPNVEASTHTFAHPLVWNIDLTSEEDRIRYKTDAEAFSINNKAILSWNIPNYKFSPEEELIGSLKYINEELTTSVNQGRLIQWSGNCKPDEKTLRVAREAGLLNINGGDPRFDRLYPSYMHLAPLYHKMGNEIQVFTAGTNDNVYMFEDWEEPTYGAYSATVQTFENTEKPIRVSPINIYYHFFSAERHAALFAVKTVYNWLRTQIHFPMFTTKYVESVHGWINGEIESIGSNVYRITNTGQCRTVRFNQDYLFPDMIRSKNILGFMKYQNSLYVHLDENNSHDIYLTRSAPSTIYLDNATAEVENYTLSKNNRISFTTLLHKKGSFTFKNLKPNFVYYVTQIKGAKSSQFVFKSNEKGELILDLEGYGTFNVEVSTIKKSLF